MELSSITAIEAGRLVREKSITAAELVRHSIETIKKAEPDINACVTVLEEEAFALADKIQAKIDAGEKLSPLAGVPFAVKDNICTDGIKTTCSSKMLGDFMPPYSAAVYNKLLAAGAIPVAKANMDEFAMGASTETSYFGATKNPWNISRVPGGSSGGSAAAVAAGEAFFALGSDTGGSIRQPCSFCGISGIKPTYGAVSRYGLIAYASSLDQIGPMGMDIKDCAEIFSIIGGHDPKDSTSIKTQPLQDKVFDGDVRGMKIGIPSNYFGEGLDDGVRENVMAAGKTLEQMGAVLVPVELPMVGYAVPAYYIVACAEASSNLSRYDGVKYGFSIEDAGSLEELYLSSRSMGFGDEVKRRIMLGSFVLSSGYFDAYYKKSMQARELIQQDFTAAFEKCDMILSPNSPTVAYKIGENISDPLKMYLGDIYTVSVNLSGLPAVTLPCGSSGNMPVGMQLIGRPFDEATLIRAAHAFQLNTDYHKQFPARRKEWSC